MIDNRRRDNQQFFLVGGRKLIVISVDCVIGKNNDE